MKYLLAWIKKYVFRAQSPSCLWMGYKYEWDHLMAKKGEKHDQGV